MKDVNETLSYKGKDYKLVFNFNVFEAIQEEYGTLNAWVEEAYGKDTGEPSMKALAFIVAAMVNEGIDIDNEDRKPEEQLAPITPKTANRILSELGLTQAVATIDELISKSTEPGEDSKNE